jgi:uncharacterized protein (DUF2147 family)
MATPSFTVIGSRNRAARNVSPLQPLQTYRNRSGSAPFAVLSAGGSTFPDGEAWMTLVKTMAAFALLAGLGLAPVTAADLSPEGSWQSATGEARVAVTLCGDGTQLCAQLVWLSDEAQTEDNLALMNALVVNKAKAVDVNEWKGTVHFDGDSAVGSIVLVSDNTMTVSGCKLVCKTFKFSRL